MFLNYNSNKEICSDEEDETAQWSEATEVNFFADNIYDNLHLKVENISTANVNVKCFSCTEVVKNIPKSNRLIATTEEHHSDLITGYYEGGFKVWNGTFDIFQTLASWNYHLKNKRVLDLGCGNGLLGIYAMLHGAFVVFQDYNEEVLKYMTVPNVKLNVKDAPKQCKFFCGDWGSFTRKFSDMDKFDYILTSDTIYNVDTYRKLHNLFAQFLKPSGSIYLGAKTYYFGLSGSIAQFTNYLNNKSIFTCESVYSVVEGIKREVIKIEFK